MKKQSRSRAKMLLKCALHVHSLEDFFDQGLQYTAWDVLVRAKKLGLDVVALTHHNQVFDTPELRQLARELEIVFLPGIEISIQKAHVLVINATKEAEAIDTLEDLREYRNRHPECFIIAPHPYFYLASCLGRKLEKNIELFDAIERSYFCTKLFDPNKKALAIAQKYQKPFLATSDCHLLRLLDVDYFEVEAEARTADKIFEAIKKGHYQNYTRYLGNLEIVQLGLEMMTQGTWLGKFFAQDQNFERRK